MKIKTLEVAGIGPAIHAMRNPYDSWDKSDTVHGRVGTKDKELSERLANAGPEHCKHLRMCQVWAEITAPRYWWTQFDTYRHGVEKVSCSTMHRLTARPLTLDDFEETPTGKRSHALDELIKYLNELMDGYNTKTDDRKLQCWSYLIQMLPQSYLQRRTVMVSYAALRSMYNQRKGHKLKQWQQFRDWCETLPESWMITGWTPEPTGDDGDAD